MHRRRSGSGPSAAPAEKIGIEDFTKVEMRVGQVKTAERIVGADKLLKLTVDIGSEIRQICAGIAQYYEPESLIGRKVVVVVNLAPRKLRGVESNGMIVAASVGPEGSARARGLPRGCRGRRAAEVGGGLYIAVLQTDIRYQEPGMTGAFASRAPSIS